MKYLLISLFLPPTYSPWIKGHPVIYVMHSPKAKMSSQGTPKNTAQLLQPIQLLSPNLAGLS